MLPTYIHLRLEPSDHRDKALKRVFVIVMSILTIIYLPIMLFSEDIIMIMYGIKWIDASVYLPVLTFVGRSEGLLRSLHLLA